MLRKTLLKSFVGIGLAAALATATALPVRAETVLTFGGSDAVGSLLDRANMRFSQIVNERGAGKVRVNFIQGEQLGNDVQVIEQMMQGSVHLYGDVLGWYANWVKDFAILNWGFTFDGNDHVQKFLDSDVYAAMADKLRETQGIRILAAAPTQPRVLFARQAVNSPADLDGMKMRVPEIRTYLLLWETLGTRPSRVAWAEVFLGLKTGTIVAAEGPVSSAFAQKFHQAAPYVMRTDHLVSDYHITMNEAAYQALAPDVRDLLVAVAREVTAWARAEAEAETDGIIAKMAAEGATIVQLDTAPFAEKALAGVQAMETDGEWPAGLWQKIRDLR
jgi:TRAP-type C4-dicarboxylate transport system substrate-binding protein